MYRMYTTQVDPFQPDETSELHYGARHLYLERFARIRGSAGNSQPRSIDAEDEGREYRSLELGKQVQGWIFEVCRMNR